jgi:type I restriction enzyme S subunit
MIYVKDLITDNIDVWTSAIKKRNATGRGSSKKIELTGVKKLRELILELAVRGSLVPQDGSDDPASVLLENIAEEKAQLIDEKKIKKQKALPEIKDAEKQFELPSGWEPIRLGITFNSIASGGTPSKREPSYWGHEIPWASVKDLGTQRYISATQDHITEKGLQAGSRLANVDDLLICTRMGLGKISIVKQPMAFNQDLKAVSLTSYIDVEFFLNTYATIKIKGTGTTVAGIKQEELLNYVVGLPPLAEQHRIVAKVDELMALCDQLEQQTEQSLTAHQTLVEVLLAALTNCDSADDFQTSWQRIAEHFDVLFTTELSIEQLKQTILQLAVMGKLVPQNPSDEPASLLLEKIAEEKTQLIADKMIKKQKQLPAITDEEKPFALPKGWEWSRVWNIAKLITSGSRDWAKHYSEEGAIFVTMGNLSRGNYRLRLDTLRYVNPPAGGEGSRTKLEGNDLLLSITGDVGNLGLIPKDFGEAYINQHTCLLRFMPDCQNRYFPELMRSPLAKYQFDAPQRGIKNSFRLGDVGEMIVPIPPLAEQHRIVAKVDELMALCEQLKARLSDAQTTQLHLADAVVENALT